MNHHSIDETENTRHLLIARTVEECHVSHPDTGRVAEIFYGVRIPDEESPTIAEIAAAIGLDFWDAWSHVGGVNHIARRVLADHVAAVRATPRTEL